MEYVHGYSERETRRLREQALILEGLLHSGTSYPAGSRVLEVGCGVGAQTTLLARRNPGIQLTSIDVSSESLGMARQVVQEMGFENVTFMHTDILNHDFKPSQFDHIFVCFVLEHMEDPQNAIAILQELIRERGSVTIIEGDHGSGCWTPETKASKNAWNGLIQSQRNLGHDPFIGRRLYPLLNNSDLIVKEVSPCPIYADASNKVLLDGVVNQIITPMVFSAGRRVLKENLIASREWKKGLEDLSRIASIDEGTFFYTWFKGVGIKP